MIARHVSKSDREKNLRIITRLRVLISAIFAVGALGVGVYCGLSIGGVIKMDWVIFVSILAGLIVGNSFAWTYLDDRERKEC